jgi:hypothetical protein
VGGVLEGGVLKEGAHYGVGIECVEVVRPE